MTRRAAQILATGVAVVTLIASWAHLAHGQTKNSCIDCHAGLPDVRLRNPAVSIKEDVHITKGLSCQDCHGGDPAHGHAEGNAALAHDRSRGFRGAPKPIEIPELCARCHSDVDLMKQYNPKLRVDQLLEYRSSHHGKLLAEGDERVATCTSCHGVHGILPVKDTRSPVYKTNIVSTCGICHANQAYMASYGIPTDQVEAYIRSIHGQKLLKDGDLGAPACNNCHGNHGATPPGISSLSQVCGECHANNRDYFNESPHKKAFAEMEVGECITCHNHHDIAKPTDQLVGTSDESVCMMCHSEGEPAYDAAAAISKALDSVKFMLKVAHERIDKAERGGVDVALGKFDLHSADDALIKARTAVHHFNVAQFMDVINPGFSAAENVIAQGDEALNDLQMRRVGLAFTIPLILLIAGALILKIRQIERGKPFKRD